MEQKDKTAIRRQRLWNFYYKHHKVLSQLAIAKASFGNRAEGAIKARNRRTGVSLASSDLAWKSFLPQNQIDKSRLLERICDAYILSKADQPKSGPYAVSGMWEEILEGQYKDMILAAKQKDTAKLGRILENIGRKNSLGLSMSGGLPSRRNPWSLNGYLNDYVDNLLGLAVFVGIREVAKDMDNSYFLVAKKMPAAALWKKICAQVGIDPSYPTVGNSFGLLYKSPGIKCAVPIVAFRHLYSALRAHELIGKVKNASVVEIGGGFGGIIYYIFKLSPKNMRLNLKSIDIPEINIISSYFLSKALPDIPVYFYGEKDSLKTKDKGNSIFILPNWSLEEVASNSVDLTLNEDSFPEMPSATMMKYLERIGEFSQYFYSVNQDCGRVGQNRLSQIKPEKVGLECIGYNIAWMRRGYFERIYRSVKNTSSSNKEKI